MDCDSCRQIAEDGHPDLKCQRCFVDYVEELESENAKLLGMVRTAYGYMLDNRHDAAVVEWVHRAEVLFATDELVKRRGSVT